MAFRRRGKAAGLLPLLPSWTVRVLCWGLAVLKADYFACRQTCTRMEAEAAAKAPGRRLGRLHSQLLL